MSNLFKEERVTLFTDGQKNGLRLGTTVEKGIILNEDYLEKHF